MGNVNVRDAAPLVASVRDRPLQSQPSAIGRPPSRPGLVPSAVPFPRWRQARDGVIAGLLAGQTQLLVTGPAGTGKTQLLDDVGRVLRAAGWTVVVCQGEAEPVIPAHDGPLAIGAPPTSISSRLFPRSNGIARKGTPASSPT